MRESSLRQTRQLVLVGGGHAHVAVLKAFGMNRMPDVRLLLVSNHWDSPYSGMLPAMIAGHYSRDAIHVDLHRLCRFAGGDFCRDRVVGLDLEARRVHLAEHPAVHFDLLSINTGSTPDFAGIPGAAEHAVPVKPIDSFLERMQLVEQQLLNHRGGPFRLVTVGGGAGGVELTLSLQHRFQQLLRRKGGTHPELECTLITASAQILPGHNHRAQALFERELQAKSVRLQTSSPVIEVTPQQVVCGDGIAVPFDALFWATHAAAPSWPRSSGLAVDEQGFIAVNSALQSLSHPLVYAAGDVAAMTGTPRPKSGVFAVRQGLPLARNLRLALMGFPPRRYRPQRTYLSLISTGDQRAVASKGLLTASGSLVWKWKQHIDQKWMRQYRDLPSMPQPDDEMDFTAKTRGNREIRNSSQAEQAGMRCGGCGAKIGSLILHDALRQLSIEPNPAVILGLNAPDDAAVFSPPPGRWMVQSVDFFRTFINDPWLFGRIGALHALNDLYAMGASPLVAQATAILELASHRIMVERLVQMLAGGVKELGEAGATLVGGHSAEGLETALGFAVTGSVGRHELFRKSGIRPGDQLLVTKAIGTGVLFAADMRFQLPASQLAPAVENMLQSNRRAAAVLHEHGVTACTDISGFGLLGHLREMAVGLESSLEIHSSAIPVLPGALELIAAGIESSMSAANAHNLHLLPNIPSLLGAPLSRLLLDPQTSGPLLAAIPAEHAQSAVDALRAEGYANAATIATVLPEKRQTSFCLA